MRELIRHATVRDEEQFNVFLDQLETQLEEKQIRI